MNYLRVKHDEDFQEKIVDVFKYLALDENYRLVGSSSAKSILFGTDYDMLDNVKDTGNIKTILHLIKKEFQKKFEIADKSANMYIMDFKCGVDDRFNEETDREKYILRWNKHEVKKGYKILPEQKIRLMEDCFLQKAVLKLDLVVFIEGRFEEFSEFYFLNIDGYTNFDPFSKADLQKSLLKDYQKYAEKGSILKSLKRVFSYYKLEPKKYLKKIVKINNFLNTEVGLMYQANSQLGVICEILQQDFKPAPIDDVRTNLQIIKQDLSRVFKIPLKSTLSTEIDKICELKSKKSILSAVQKLEDYLASVYNKATADFLSKNKDLIKI
jgi:hypothetical protein